MKFRHTVTIADDNDPEVQRMRQALREGVPVWYKNGETNVFIPDPMDIKIAVLLGWQYGQLRLLDDGTQIFTPTVLS